jgi:TonB family protein
MLRKTSPFQVAPAVSALVALLSSPTMLGAQLPHTRVSGSAVSETGERVVGAQVRVVGSASAPTVTGEDGTFELFVLNDMAPRLVVRRIGFRPETLSVQLPLSAAPLVVRMTRAIQMVRPVIVSATTADPHSVLAAVKGRERTSGNGHFAYRADFMRNNPAKFSDILRRVPGITFGRTRTSALAVRLRGSNCAPLYWLDNQPLLGIPFDPDVMPPSTIEAIEVYSGASLVPPQFQGPPYAQGCGAIVIWTRQGERPVRRPKIDADSIVRLLDAQRLFVASEVERPARLVAMQEPEFPDSLRSAGVGGSAVIEFIIEADGKLNRESIGVVSATHMKFADAVRLAVLDAQFLPAMRNGRDVAQVYQLPVTFTAPKP